MSEKKKLEKQFNDGHISRREFIGKMAVLGAATSFSPLLFGGIAQAAPKKGGTFRMGIGGGSTTDTLDPGKLTDIFIQTLNMQLRTCLVEIDPNGQPVGDLAESWEASKDAATWTFNLRKGVEFHNGKSLTAEDVVWSINYHRGKDSKSAAKGIIDPIKDIKTDGKNKVVFTLNGGNADFPFILSDYHLAILPKDTTDFEKGIGTGPFILKTYEPGVRAHIARNPNYYKNNLPYFDEVEMLVINDVNARTNALKTGQVDVINRCDRKTLHFLEKMKQFKVIKSSGTRHFSVPMIMTNKPYDDNNVRMALKYAVDREQMVKQILRGYGSVGNDIPIGRGQRYFASEIEQRKYDPDKAKFYIKKAGLTDHVFKLHTSDAAFGGAVDAAVLYKESAAKAGIKIDVVKEPKDGYWSNVWMKKSWSFCFWGGRPTEDLMFSTAYAADANWNDSFWKHKHFNELLVQARSELDDGKRRKMYVEMQQIVRDEGGVVIPMFAMDLMTTSAKVGFGKVASNYELDGMKAPERWWFV